MMTDRELRYGLTAIGIAFVIGALIGLVVVLAT